MWDFFGGAVEGRQFFNLKNGFESLWSHYLEMSHNWYWPSLERSVVANATWRFEPSHFREFGSVDLIGKAPGPNPVVRKFLM